MVGYFAFEDFLQLFHRLFAQLVLFVYDWFEVFDCTKAFQNIGELYAIYTTVIKQYSVDFSCIKVLASSGKTWAVPWRELVVMQAESLLYDFV